MYPVFQFVQLDETAEQFQSKQILIMTAEHLIDEYLDQFDNQGHAPLLPTSLMSTEQSPTLMQVLAFTVCNKLINSDKSQTVKFHPSLNSKIVSSGTLTLAI